MQLELLELTILGLVFLPLAILSILFLLEIQKNESREKLNAIYGFLTFILMFMYFFMNWLLPIFVTVDDIFIVILFGCAFAFLPVWVVSFTKSNLMVSYKIPLAIVFFVIWAVYVIPRLMMTINLSFYFLTTVFAISIIFLLIRVVDDRKLILLLFGLLLIYMERGLSFFDVIIEFSLIIVGLWLVLIWYLLRKRGS